MKLSALSLGLSAIPSVIAGYDCYISPYPATPKNWSNYRDDARAYAKKNCSNWGFTFKPGKAQDNDYCHANTAAVPAVFNEFFYPLLTDGAGVQQQFTVSYKCLAPRTLGPKKPGKD